MTPGLKVGASKKLATEARQQHACNVSTLFAISSSDIPSLGHRVRVQLRSSRLVPLHTTKLIRNPLTPNDPYRGRTAPLNSKRCILCIYSTNISTEYFKRGIYSQFFVFKMQFVS